MSRRLLIKEFFRDNPYKENSVQRFVYSTLLYKGMEQTASDFLLKQGELDCERREAITHEKEMILAEQNPAAIFQLLRKNVDGINRAVLIDRALASEDIILPMVVEKLVRSDHDTFIDNAIRLLAWSEKDYSPLLLERYAEFRSPYVRSLVCLILGFRGKEDIISWMLDRFFEMKKQYPDETYDQGPLFALHELSARFYKR